VDQIQDIKTKYGQQAEGIIATGLGLVSKNKKYRCPNSMAHKNGDRNPSMGWDSNALQFYCFACNMKIDLYGYYREHLNYTHNEIVYELLGEEGTTRLQSNRSKFQDGCKEIKDITEDVKKYIMGRGITEETMSKFGIRSFRNNVAFPYYKYDSLIGYKVRNLDKDKKMWGVEGSKPFLFGFQLLDDNFEELIVCEGEFDCMVLNQCGYNNVVSVGAGANSLASLLDQAKDFLDKYENIIVVSDNDPAGDKMDLKFTEIFETKAKLINKDLYTKNDINGEFYKRGPQAIHEIIESARFKIEGRRDLDITPYKGVEKKTGTYIPTGMDKIDYAINDLAPGCVTIIVGRTNAGKTTFTKQIISNAIDLGNKVFCVTGEGDQEIFINEIYKNVIGRNEELFNKIKVNKRYYKEPKKEVLDALARWHKNKLVIFNKGDSKLKSMDQLFDTISYEIKHKKHNLVIIDNLMSLLTISTSNEKNDAQGEFIQKCCDIAKAYNTHIIVVVHPRKPINGKESKEINIENISGSMDIGNKADNIISVTRDYSQGATGGSIKVLKNRYFSQLPEVETHFEEETGLLLGINDETGLAKAYKFDWEKYLDKNFKNSLQIYGEQESIEDCPF